MCRLTRPLRSAAVDQTASAQTETVALRRWRLGWNGAAAGIAAAAGTAARMTAAAAQMATEDPAAAWTAATAAE